MRVRLPRGPEKDEWHCWFAWRPVLTDADDRLLIVWLEWVERRSLGRGHFSGTLIWDYR